MIRSQTRGRVLSPFVLLGVVAVLAAGAVFVVRGSSRPEQSGGAGRHEAALTVPAGTPVVGAAPSLPPADGMVLPEGTRVVEGHPTGFPHSDLGPVAAQAALAEAQIGFDYDQAARVARIYAAPEARSLLIGRSRTAVQLRREQAGVPPDGAVPASASYAMTPVAFTVTELDTDDSYAVNLLSYVTLVAADGSSRDFLYAGTQLFRWTEGDWKVVEGSPADLARLARQGQPRAAVPGTPEFEKAGWNLIRREYQ